MNYQLKISKNQAQVIMKACEILARLHMNQINLALSNTFLYLPCEKLDEIRKKAKEINDIICKEGCYSISSKEIPEESRTAWDLHQVLRYQISHDIADKENVLHRTGVCYYEPLKFGLESLAEIKSY